MRRIIRLGKWLGGGVLVLVVLITIAVFVLAARSDATLVAKDTPYPDIVASRDPEVVARGEYVFRTAGHCTQCHIDYPRMHPEQNTRDTAPAGGFPITWGPLGTFYASNLTPDADTGLGRRTDGEVARAIANGVLADGRVSFFMRYGPDLAREDLVAVVSYLRSLPPARNEVPTGGLSTAGKAIFGMYEIGADLGPLPAYVPPAETPSLERGAYLAEHVALCVQCHSKLDMQTFRGALPKAGGGDPDPSAGDDVDNEYIPPNLTAHPTGITGRLDEDQFVARMHQGRAHPASKMPWENVSRMSDADLRAIYRYLRTLPPVDNDVGPTVRPKGWRPPA